MGVSQLFRAAFLAYILGLAASLAVAADVDVDARAKEVQTLDAELYQAWLQAGSLAGKYGPRVANQSDWSAIRLKNTGTFTGMPLLAWYRVIAQDREKYSRYLRLTKDRIAGLKQLIAEAPSGTVSEQTLKMLELPPLDPLVEKPKVVQAVPEKHVPVDPLKGTQAKIERAGASATLTYIDAGHVQHRYIVKRMAGVDQMVGGSDVGAWIFVAPDHQSGLQFNLDAGGHVAGKVLNPLMLHLISGT